MREYTQTSDKWLQQPMPELAGKTVASLLPVLVERGEMGTTRHICTSECTENRHQTIDTNLVKAFLVKGWEMQFTDGTVLYLTASYTDSVVHLEY